MFVICPSPSHHPQAYLGYKEERKKAPAKPSEKFKSVVRVLGR
jgi:hypothetical protein